MDRLCSWRKIIIFSRIEIWIFLLKTYKRVSRDLNFFEFNLLIMRFFLLFFLWFELFLIDKIRFANNFLALFFLSRFHCCHATHALTSFISFEFFLKLSICLLLKIHLQYFILIDLLVNKLLSILAWKLILWNVGEFLMHNGSLFPLRIENRCTFSYLSQTSDNSSMNETYRFIDIRIVNSGYESFFSFLYQILLNDSDTGHIFNVLIESRVDCHVLSSNSESLLVFIFICNTDNEGDARGIFFHHFIHKWNSQMNTLNNHRFVSYLIVLDNFLKLSLYFTALIFISHKSSLLFGGYFFRNLKKSLIN